MKYRLRNTGEIKTKEEIIHSLPSGKVLPKVWGEPVFEDLQIDPILETPKPEVTEFQIAYVSGAEQDALGNWVQAWTVTDKFKDVLDDEGNVVTTAQEQINAYLQEKTSSLYRQYHDTIKSKVDAKMDNLKNGYSEREIQSWPVQLKEAEALLVDPSAPTPFLSNAKRDSETVEEYAAKVRANNAAWSLYAGKVVNWRAEMEDALDACTTEADYKALLETINNA